MKKLFLIQHAVFDSQTLVAVGLTDDRIKKWVDQNTDIKTDETFMALIACHGVGRCVSHGSFTMIRLLSWSGTNRDISLLTHEAFHLAEFIYDRIGIKHNVECSGEAFAYFIQHTVEQILDVLCANTTGQ